MGKTKSGVTAMQRSTRDASNDATKAWKPFFREDVRDRITQPNMHKAAVMIATILQMIATV